MRPLTQWPIVAIPIAKRLPVGGMLVPSGRGKLGTLSGRWRGSGHVGHAKRDGRDRRKGEVTIDGRTLGESSFQYHGRAFFFNDLAPPANSPLSLQNVLPFFSARQLQAHV